jgi:predicted ATPase
MGWAIGRAAAVEDPEAARRKALAKLRNCAELDDPESLVVPILLDAVLLVESYRGARHQITFLPELTRSVDALLRELTIIEKTQEWVEP